MIPWDYNLAFGTFQGNNASSAVNDDIDDVLSDRPMQAWIFSDEIYSQQYYVQLFRLPRYDRLSCVEKYRARGTQKKADAEKAGLQA